MPSVKCHLLVKRQASLGKWTLLVIESSDVLVYVLVVETDGKDGFAGSQSPRMGTET